MLNGLRTVIYKVKELELAKKWYTSFVGHPPYFDQPFYVGYNVGGYELGLDPNQDHLTTGNNVTYWGVDDLRAEVARVHALGARVVSDVQDVGDGILVATVADPFGNVIGLIQNPNFKLEA
jgi:predicted enzyme related to lactoylglutathione lyase